MFTGESEVTREGYALRGKSKNEVLKIHLFK